MPQMKQLIVGAGLGGFCLAQMLRKTHMDVEVYERDGSPWDRPQGYHFALGSSGRLTPNSTTVRPRVAPSSSAP